ncbi:MAG: glycosyltransferase family 2 protein [Ferruginibacter sp.]
MKVSGFTIIKNALLNDYPVTEAIRSILPLVDEMIVLVGDCSDSTRALIAGIGDEKIKIYDSTWDANLRQGGSVLAVETNKALELIDPASTWAFYIQADEVVHEKYYDVIRQACKKYEHEKEVQGLLFDYLHFYGNYNYTGDSRVWYLREVRIIRAGIGITSFKDAQGFRLDGKRIQVKKIAAAIYHYGWVKTPQQMHKKIKQVTKFWHEDSPELERQINSEDFFNYDEFDSLKIFTGTHPQVMQPRIKSHGLDKTFDLSKKNIGLKDRLLLAFEKLTGIRPFTFRNYKKI